MRVCILSRNPKLYSTRRLREAGAARGHSVEIIDYLRCYVNITSRQPKVMNAGKVLEPFDVVIPRVASSTESFYGAAIVRQFELTGAYCLNSSQSISRAGDKLRSLQLLSRRNIDLPITGFAHSTKDKDLLIKMVGGPPLVVKLLQGTQGVGVVLAETRKAAEAVIGAFEQLDANFLVQEFIKEAEGSDVRVFVVGGKVVAAMKRTAPPGDFRSNLHRGGTSEAVQLSKREREVAVSAAAAMRLNAAGVDIIRSARGPLVIEVNASPGLEGIEQTTKVDVAGRIYEYIERRVATRNKNRAPLDA